MSHAWILCLTLAAGNAAGHVRCEVNATDSMQLLQMGERPWMPFPRGCFILEEHFQVRRGVLRASLRFGPGGNAAPSDVRCIASKEVRSIVGSLSVTGASSLVSVLLPNLEVVRGSLAFTQLPKLQSESFKLTALRRVDENLVLRATALSTLSLPRLWKVARTLELRSNSLLATVDLSSLAKVDLHLLIESNPLLKLLSCPSLQKIAYDLIVEGNQGLQEISFPVLSDVGEDLEIFVLDDLVSLHFPKLVSIGEDAEFANLMKLKHMELPKLKFIGEDFEVYSSYALKSLSMPSLLYVKEDLEIHHLPVCESIFLPKLSEVKEDFEVYSLALTTLNLPSLKTIREDLILGGMPLTSELSMPQLGFVGGSFWLYDTALLEVDLPKLVKVGGKRKIAQSPSGCHYTLGDCVEEEPQEESLYITNNSRLERISMGGLTSIRCRYVAIFGNKALQSVGLPSLRRFIPHLKGSYSSSSSLFTIFRNKLLTLLELNPLLPEPESWTFDANAASFTVRGPGWANLQGTVSVAEAEGEILEQCSGAGLEDGFKDAFCRQAECPIKAVRKMSACSDCGSCLLLSQVYVTVPDSEGGEAILGSIFLTSRDPIMQGVTCIEAGPGLTSIQGCIELENTELRSIDLQQLRSINGSLRISGNPYLEEVIGTALEEVSRDLVLQGNMGLQDVNLPVLELIGGRFSTQGHAFLQTLELLSLRQAGSIFVASAPLRTLTVPLLQKTTSQLRIWQLNSLGSLKMPSLQQAGEDLMLAFCSSLEHLEVPELQEVDEDLEFYVLNSLESISFPRLIYVGEDLEIYTLDALCRLRFPSLERIGEDLEFFDNTAILDLDADSFPSLLQVSEDLEIYVCAQLRLLEVPKLSQVDEDLLLFGNPVLQRLQLFQLEGVAAREGGGMLITDNLLLSSLDLPSLRRLGNSTARRGSRDGTEDIRLYTGARRVRGQEARPVLIAHNPELAHISLPKLEILNTGLWIQKNDALEKVDLNALEAGLRDQFFVLRFNPALGHQGLKAGRLLTAVNSSLLAR